MSWTYAPPTPFGDPCERIHLENAPLARVLAQVRFSPVVSISSAEYIAGFQEAIRDEYPILNRELQQQVILGPQGIAPNAPPPGVIWRFNDVEQIWQVSLAQDFIAVETTAYTDRHEFFQRLDTAINSLEQHIKPSLTTRIGIRYVDRLSGDPTMRLGELVRPELLSLEATDLGAGTMMRGITEAHFATDDTTLKARWGSVPPEVAHDPIIPAIEEASWVLDLDVSTVESGPFNAGAVAESARKFGDIIYRFFRWSVSDEFLNEYGGEV